MSRAKNRVYQIIKGNSIYRYLSTFRWMDDFCFQYLKSFHKFIDKHENEFYTKIK